MAWWKRSSKAEDTPADPNLPLIRLEGITKIFKGDADEETRALDDVTVDIERGEYVSVSGPSGCGKSTFLSMLALLDAPTKGRYYLQRAARRPAVTSEKARVRNVEIGLIFQSFNLIGDMTVYENVEYPLTLRGVSADERKARVDAALDARRTGPARKAAAGVSVGGTSTAGRDRARHRGASADRAGRRADRQPRLEERRSGDGDVRELNAAGATVCLATHNPRYIAMAKRNLYLFDGKVVPLPIED